MNDIPLKALGLESRWPKLGKLQAEVQELERRHQEAAGRVAEIRAGLDAARDRDLVAEAKAVRAGEEPPEPRHEPEARRELERAERERDVLQRAHGEAAQELAGFVAEHRRALYQDVTTARDALGREVAESAKKALAGYARYEDLGYAVKSLAPPPPKPDEFASARRLTNMIAAPATTANAFGGPPRGDVERILGHLAGLGEHEAGASPAGGGEDAA